MTIRFEWEGIDEWLTIVDRLEGTPLRLAAQAHTVQQEALGHLILGARANIYDTPDGAYRRTQDYLRSLNATVTTRRDGMSVTVSSESPYAAFVEQGRPRTSLAALQTAAANSTDPVQPMTLGRSGVDWHIPAPIVTGAQYFALWKMMQCLIQSSPSKPSK